jgi:hypothetical protein
MRGGIPEIILYLRFILPTPLGKTCYSGGQGHWPDPVDMAITTFSNEKLTFSSRYALVESKRVTETTGYGTKD